MEQKIYQLIAEQGERLKQIEALIMNTKKVFNLEDLCLYTGLSKSHIYKLTCTSEIPHFKRAKHLYFDRDEIERWLKEYRHKPINEIEKEASSYIIKGRLSQD